MTGPVDSGGSSAHVESTYLTDSPDGWRSRCADEALARQLRDCERLAGASARAAEAIALALNVEASRRGIFPGGLPELHFAHGRYASWSVEDLLDASRSETAPPAPLPSDAVQAADVLADLVVSVNRAFIGGRDAGVLSRWVSTPVCDTERPMEGPEAARCGALDGECARGRFIESRGCCTLELALPGVMCSEGVCNRWGACRAESAVPDAGRVHGAVAWVELMSEGMPHIWHLTEPERVRVAVRTGDTEAAEGEETPTPETWVPRTGAQIGTPVAEIAGAHAERSRVRIGLIDGGAPLAGAGLEAVGGVALHVVGQPERVCVVAGDRGSMTSARS